MSDLEAGRRAAHIFLDGALAWSDETTDEEQDGMVQLAMEGLYDIGCVTATFDDATDTANVDITDLAGGVLVLVHALVERLERETGLDRETLIAEMREATDSEFQ